MAISVADNFSYKGSKPLDARTKFITVVDMVATPAADLYDGCLAYVTGTKKNYQYDSTNEVDETLGKWRELQTGGGGTTVVANPEGEVTDELEKLQVGNNIYSIPSGGGGADTEIIADDFDPTESYAVGDYVVYEGILYKCTTAHTGAWDASDFDATQVMDEIPTPMPAVDMSDIVTPLPGVMSRRFKYSTEEQVVGEWIDGKPVYQIVIDCGTLPNNGISTITHNISNIDSIVGYDGIAIKPSDGTIRFIPTPTGSDNAKLIGVAVNKVQISIWSPDDWSAYTKTYVTLRYTKTTD